MGEQLVSSFAPTILSREMSERKPLYFAGTIGFFFVFRASLTFLFFQGNPVLGSIANVSFGLILLFGVILYSTPASNSSRPPAPFSPPLRWVLVLLSLSLTSATWTGAQSIIAALAYWAGMAADVLIVLLLTRGDHPERYAEGLMKGAVIGAFVLALVAWCSPVTEDMRLGNAEFLHPNTLGLEFGLATLIGQYLSPLAAKWKWLSIALGITLLRTLSKTAIMAFVIAEGWYLLQNKEMSRRTKLCICAGTLLVVVCFWGLLSTYINIYANTGSGDQIETLTGRTALWAVAFSMGLEKPWLGHGIYSFKALIPAIGGFEPVHAHNEFLQQFFEYGLAGVVTVAMIYWTFFRQARRAPPGNLRRLSLALLIFALVRGLTDTTNFGLSCPLWLLAALSVCLAHPTNAEVEE
jgi:exopolysaccharide production protein ExoQ